MAGRILVLDDEENYAEMLQDLLRENSYRVDMATLPERALDQLEQLPYDLVISDYKMPVMDGADFLKRARELHPNLPIILVSGLMNTPELVKVANMSVTLVLEKPLDTAHFLKQVARFSMPMTAEEKAAIETGAEASSRPATVLTYPAEPLFFSANSRHSKRFMKALWNLSRSRSYFFLLEPPGGDGELAVKDLAFWRAQVDQPLATFAFDSFASNAEACVRKTADAPGSSQTILVRLEHVAQVHAVQSIIPRIAPLFESYPDLLLIFLCEEKSADKAEFLADTKIDGLVIAPLSDRPADVAYYAQRFAIMQAQRLCKEQCKTFLPEAVFALLLYDWPENYREIRHVLTEAVAASADAPLSGEIFRTLASSDASELPEAKDRLAHLLLRSQKSFFKRYLSDPDNSVEALVADLNLEADINSKAAVEALPLLKPDLAKL